MLAIVQIQRDHHAYTIRSLIIRQRIVNTDNEVVR